MVLLQACEALRAIHASSIFHRDIKPDTMLLSKDGNLLLDDFDVSCSEWDPIATHNIDAGTADFRSPRLDGDGPVRFQALDDWASLGLSIARLTGLYKLGSSDKRGALRELAQVPWIPERLQQQLSKVV